VLKQKAGQEQKYDYLRDRAQPFLLQLVLNHQQQAVVALRPPQRLDRGAVESTP
jgi:hypothetical protein